MEKETFILSVNSFNDLYLASWAGAIQTLDAIREHNKEEEFIDLINNMIEDCFNGKIGETELNDFIWFDTDYIEEALDCKLWDQDE